MEKRNVQLFGLHKLFNATNFPSVSSLINQSYADAVIYIVCDSEDAAIFGDVYLTGMKFIWAKGNIIGSNVLDTSINKDGFIILKQDGSSTSVDGSILKLGTVTPYDSSNTILDASKSITLSFVDIEKTIIKNTKPVIIRFPSELMTDENKVIGPRGETIYEIEVENEGTSFYDTIGADPTETFDEYFDRLKNQLVLLDGTASNYMETSCVFKTDDNGVTITWHANFYLERDDNQGIDNNVGDCVCVINYKKKVVSFAMTQWPDDEMHMIHPIRIFLDTVIDSFGTDNEKLTITLKWKPGDTWETITSTKIIEFLKYGYNLVFGAVEKEGTDDEYFTPGIYDVYYTSSIMNKDWLVLRWLNFDKGESSYDSYWFTNTFSVVIFDLSGVCEVYSRNDIPVRGAAYTYKTFLDASGDSYISTYIQKDTLGSKYVLNVNANTRKLSICTSTNDGLATSYDVKNYVDTKTGDLADLSTNVSTNLVSAINELEGKTVTKDMVNSLWAMLKICAYKTSETESTINYFKTSWNITSVGTIILLDEEFQTFKLISKDDYNDINISSSQLGDLAPYFIYNGTDEIQFWIYVDGEKKYIVNNSDFYEEINDDFISYVRDDVGASEAVVTTLTSYKGLYIVNGHEAEAVYGFEYNGTSYYTVGSTYNDINQYYDENKETSIWILGNISDMIDEGTCSVGDEITVKLYKYDETMSAPEYISDITITIISKLQ